MYLRVTLLLVFLLGQRAVADVSRFYIGTLTDQSISKGIYLDSIDTDTGKLGVLTLAAEAKNPNFLALSPDNKFLFAALSDTVGSFKVRLDGTLASLNEQPSGGGGPCHVSLDKTGRCLFVANYEGGNIASFGISPEGTIGERTAFIQFTGSGPDPGRQKKSYAHSVYADPENKLVYSCDLGSDSIQIFKLDRDSSRLASSNLPAAKVPPGSGPRHLAFHPDGAFVYAVSEMGLSVTVFARNAATGTLTTLETVPTLLPGTPTKNVTAAEICCHPSGKWLYVSNRGIDIISIFAIAPNGRLTLIQNASSVAKFPRSIALDPTGKWLISAGQQDNRIAVLKIDQSTGHLTATDQSAAVGVPVCVLFAPRK